jgi:hypothetical protein
VLAASGSNDVIVVGVSGHTLILVAPVIENDGNF